MIIQIGHFIKLRREIMPEKFDNIVVGAGFAGLTCAGYLARGGTENIVA